MPLTPTERITAIHSIKLEKGPQNTEKHQIKVGKLRKLVFEIPIVDEAIEEWMNQEPIVSISEVIEFKPKNEK